MPTKSQALQTAERKAKEFVGKVKASVDERKVADLAKLRSKRAYDIAERGARLVVASKAQKVLNRVAHAIRNGQLDANALDRKRLREVVGEALTDQRANLTMRNLLSTAYNAGYFEQGKRDNTKAYFLYQTMRDMNVRPEHAKWEGLLLEKADPLVEKVFPPNGHNCRCKMTAVGRKAGDALVADGKATTEKPPLKTVTYIDKATGKRMKTLEGVDPGWMGAPDDSPEVVGKLLERSIRLLQAFEA